MQIQFNIRIDGKSEVPSKEVADTLRRMATDIESYPVVSVDDDFGMRDAHGDDVVWCVVAPDSDSEESDDDSD